MTIATKPGMLEKKAVNKVPGPKPALHILVCVCIFYTMGATKKPASSQPHKCKRTAVTSIIKRILDRVLLISKFISVK